MENVHSHIGNVMLEDLGSTVAQIGHLWLEHHDQLSDMATWILQENFVPDLQVSFPVKQQAATAVPQSQQKKRKCTFVGTGQQKCHRGIMIS